MSGVELYANELINYAQEHPCLTVIFVILVLKKLFNLFKRGKSLKDEVVFITGAANGIGRSTAIRMAKLGAKVAIADIDIKKAEQTAKEILDLKQRAIAVHCDVTSIESVNKATEFVRSHLGNPTILINNAGIVSGKSITELSYEAIERTFKVNAISHFYTIKAMLPDMLKANKGHIVTIASVAGLGGVSKMTDYCASKYAAVGIDDSLRNELRQQKSAVKTTCVCPYYINTGMFDGVSTKFTFLLPMLKEEYVSEQIVEAIRYNVPIIMMPRIMYLAIFLKGLLPTCAIDIIGEILGLQESMETFKGRA
ncbi:hypothetical protein SteCoe_24470 [Stentor coeruleus]|uniref:Short-chain dehydrogenase/reductase 3 n=1 Tax=Stentor coeruleus TaxID=5963 RepID=A0A1R2BHF2_9CILI|nr:hypothetical protein SteCoe_24470 [Stentor coeruleus]